MYQCKECLQTFEKKSLYQNHCRWQHKKREVFKCVTCEKQFKGATAFKQHICKGKKEKWICPKCNYHIKTCRQKHINYCNGLGPRRFRKRLALKGTSYEQRFGKEKADFLKHKLSVILKSNKNENSGKAKTFEGEKLRKNRIHQTCQKNKKSGGYRQGSGRGKKGWYKNYFCDSSWELAWVIFCLEHNIVFTRNTDKFEYLYENERHLYLPDFKDKNGDYVEVKGYKNGQFYAKMRCFPKDKKIKVFTEKEMKPLLEYVISKYGEDFIKLYE